MEYKYASFAALRSRRIVAVCLYMYAWLCVCTRFSLSFPAWFIACTEPYMLVLLVSPKHARLYYARALRNSINDFSWLCPVPLFWWPAFSALH